MTTTYIVRFKQQVYCPISDNIVPKVTPHSCNNAILTCLISDSIVISYLDCFVKVKMVGHSIELAFRI